MTRKEGRRHTWAKALKGDRSPGTDTTNGTFEKFRHEQAAVNNKIMIHSARHAHAHAHARTRTHEAKYLCRLLLLARFAALLARCLGGFLLCFAKHGSHLSCNL